MSYYLLSLVLYRVLPGQEVYGTKLRESGRPLKYKLNGKLAIIYDYFMNVALKTNPLKHFLPVLFSWLHAP